MSYFSTYVDGLWAMLALAALLWLVSYFKNDVSIVDSIWSLMFLVGAGVFAAATGSVGVRGAVVLLLVAAWSLRLSLYITVRNYGNGEDYRYQEMRRKSGPSFAYTSLYRVFGLQAVLAWIISIPLLFAVAAQDTPGILDAIAVAIWLVGFVFEAGGDYQLSRFKADPDNAGKVMDRGFWRLTRHPNYFGDACIWWAFYLFAVSAGAWWTIYAPAIMTFLLLKVSGVAMLERTIGDRRPDYQAYTERTNAFVPGPLRRITE